MYERILVPLDGSEVAEVALPYAEGMAESLGSEITLVHVCESEESENYHVHGVYLEKMLEATRKRAKGRDFQVKSAHLVGHAAEEIVDYAEKEDIGLILMATHGRSGIRRWFLGNVAAKVLRATTRPVGLIRAKGARADVRETGIMRRALVPLDGSKQSESVLPYIQDLAAELKGEIVLVHVVAPVYFVYSIPGETVQMPYSAEDLAKFRTKGHEYLETVVAALKEKGVDARVEVSVGSAADEIIRIADEMQVDVVAMSTHGRSGISRWAFGSTADKVLHAGNTPLLLVRVKGADGEAL
jgi:nucleotide-binding universal stress UspA family protein